MLQAVTSWTVEGAKILDLCERGDKLLEEETAKVYKGKKITKGIAHPTTVSPSSFVTPYTPLSSDAEEAAMTLKPSDVIKIQLGAQIDGFGAIVCDTVVIPSSQNEDDTHPEREADLLLATHWANELLLRLMVPPGLLATGSEEERKKAAAEKPIKQSRINELLQKVAESYGCSVVESTTCWLFERNEIEGKKKIVLAPGEGVKGDGVPDVGEVWGVEMGISRGTGKVRSLPNRPTLHRRTTTTYGLKRPSSRQLLSEVVKKFGTFPFSLRQLDDERGAKMGVLECVRANVLRQYEVVGDKDGEPVSRLFTTVGEWTRLDVMVQLVTSCQRLSSPLFGLLSMKLYINLCMLFSWLVEFVGTWRAPSCYVKSLVEIDTLSSSSSKLDHQPSTFPTSMDAASCSRSILPFIGADHDTGSDHQERLDSAVRTAVT